jgi:flagella basal body P-ring formation protein FlgA
VSFIPRKLGPPGISLPTIRPGDPIRARYLNKITSAVRNLQGVQRVETEADFTQDPVAAAQELTITRHTITTEANDTIGDGAVTIAKPDHLRGAIRVRTVSSENQVMLPAYTAGASAPVIATVYAASVGEAVTGIAGVDLLDINAIARAWAEDT